MDVSISGDPWAPEPASMTSQQAAARYPNLKEADMAARQRYLQAGATEAEVDELERRFDQLPALAQEQELQRLAGVDVTELQEQILALRAEGDEGVEGAPEPAAQPGVTEAEPHPEAGHDEDPAEDVRPVDPEPEPEPDPTAVVLGEAEALVAKIEAEKAQTAADEAKLAEGFEGKANL
ncbi:MAG: hypothetical protein ACLP50_31585 [Solirubrobacteraceae bacterium]|jgi:hypothetical protein